MPILTHLDKLLPKSTYITFVPFHSAHVGIMDIDKSQLTSRSKGVPIEAMLENQAKMGHAITALLYGSPVACFGAVDIWDGVAEMWMLIEERGRKVPILMTKAAIAYRDYIVIAKNLHRLQITVKCSDTRAFGWAKMLGFEQEAIMKRYDSEANDFYLMARI